MANFLVLDTETTGLEKPFCYDVGYVIVNADDGEVLCRKHFVIEQVWHNLPLFESSYYAEKRPLYVGLMRSKKAVMDKWGYVMQTLRRDIKEYSVQTAYAYNSQFDEKVINYNCEWFKTMNPFDEVPIYDIWGYASQYITNTADYRDFCIEHEFLTEKGNCSGSAETVHRYLTKNLDFNEAHMGMYDCDIEAQILLECFKRGAEMAHEYKVNKIIPTNKGKHGKIVLDGKTLWEGELSKTYFRKDTYRFTSHNSNINEVVKR